MLDARSWLAWGLTAMVVASTTRNPLYLALLGLITAVVGTARGSDQADAPRAILSPLRFATLAIPFSAFFNALMVQTGETSLFRLPDWLPLIGGVITLEGLAFGALSGLVLTVIFSAFSVFNQMTAVHDLVGLAPRAFHEAGVVISIALTFVPQTIRSLGRIRQAQAVRGHRLRGLRDWPPIVVPLLVSGLERSMGLAEAMVARGYGATFDQTQSLRRSAGLVLGLLALLGGWLAFLFRPAWRQAGTGLMVGGGTLIAAVVWFAGREAHHTVYQPRRWTLRDSLVLAGCGLALAGVLIPSPLGADSLYYSPYPRMTLPAFDPLVGMGLLGLLAPALAGRGAVVMREVPGAGAASDGEKQVP